MWHLDDMHHVIFFAKIILQKLSYSFGLINFKRIVCFCTYFRLFFKQNIQTSVNFIWDKVFSPIKFCYFKINFQTDILFCSLHFCFLSYLQLSQHEDWHFKCHGQKNVHPPTVRNSTRNLINTSRCEIKFQIQTNFLTNIVIEKKLNKYFITYSCKLSGDKYK